MRNCGRCAVISEGLEFDLRKPYILLISDQALLPELGRSNYGMSLFFSAVQRVAVREKVLGTTKVEVLLYLLGRNDLNFQSLLCNLGLVSSFVLSRLENCVASFVGRETDTVLLAKRQF